MCRDWTDKVPLIVEAFMALPAKSATWCSRHTQRSGLIRFASH